MKFNKSYEGGDFEDYIKYLQTVKNKIPEKLFEFISSEKRHDLGENSLHDSRVKKIEYEFISEDNYQMLLTLTGERRKFIIKFNKASQVSICQANFGDIYKDLITYEVGIEKDCFENEQLVFRAKFPFEKGIIEVFADEIEINENLLQKN